MVCFFPHIFKRPLSKGTHQKKGRWITTRNDVNVPLAIFRKASYTRFEGSVPNTYVLLIGSRLFRAGFCPRLPICIFHKGHPAFVLWLSPCCDGGGDLELERNVLFENSDFGSIDEFDFDLGFWCVWAWRDLVDI